ncbi:hypothetical protein B0T16DRAFT_386327 [Cercophora newfieldiana]|uniref:Uncharacterized protein n=1 Tax=Cercophora newfieldiana TaxID=92897 RepID=A0AA39YSK7_9PEZI|nr:hypothetical protein B0T16DRAFT_386327 [Cercophora newfieldiana]
MCAWTWRHKKSDGSGKPAGVWTWEAEAAGWTRSRMSGERGSRLNARLQQNSRSEPESDRTATDTASSKFDKRRREQQQWQAQDGGGGARNGATAAGFPRGRWNWASDALVLSPEGIGQTQPDGLSRTSAAPRAYRIGLRSSRGTERRGAVCDARRL